MMEMRKFIKNEANVVIERKDGILFLKKNRFDTSGIVITAEQAMKLMDEHEKVVITNFEVIPN